MRKFGVAVSVGVLLIVGNVSALDLASQGEITFESRAFESDGLSDTVDTGVGMVARLRSRLRQDDWTAFFRGYSRVDRNDSGRSIVIVEDAWLSYTMDNWKVLAGSQMLNWTALEAFHPADVMNSRQTDSSVSSPDKIGQWMLMLEGEFDDGILSIYYMPRREGAIFPSSVSRLRQGASTIGSDLFLNSDGRISSSKSAHQGGIRYQQLLFDTDVSVHVLQHYDRLRPFFQNNNGVLQPVYIPVLQLGGTAQRAWEDWLFKMEFAYRNYSDKTVATIQGVQAQKDHFQLALGTETTLYHDNDFESTFIGEYQTIFGATKAERARLDLFQNDILLGYRLSLNDLADTQIMTTLITDLERSNEFLGSLQFSRRITDTWKISAGLQWVSAAQKGATPLGLEALDRADYIFLNVSRFF